MKRMMIGTASVLALGAVVASFNQPAAQTAAPGTPSMPKQCRDVIGCMQKSPSKEAICKEVKDCVGPIPSATPAYDPTTSPVKACALFGAADATGPNPDHVILQSAISVPLGWKVQHCLHLFQNDYGWKIGVSFSSVGAACFHPSGSSSFGRTLLRNAADTEVNTDDYIPKENCGWTR